MKSWALYTLSDNGKVFYVGISSNLLNRYKQHCGHPFELTHYYIYWMRQRDKLPTLNILQYFHSQSAAEMAEIALIRYFITVNHKLCNDDINTLKNRLINCNPYPIAPKQKRLKKGYAEEKLKDAKARYFELWKHDTNKNYKRY